MRAKKLRKLLTDEYGLEPRERRYCDRYLIHGDMRRALREAYGENHQRNDSKLRAKPEIIAYLKMRQEEVRARFSLSIDWIIQELLYTARFRKRDLYNEDGSIKPVHEWPDYVDAAIASIETEDIWAGKGEDRERVGEVVKFKQHDRNDAIRMLMRYLGVEQGHSNTGKDRLHEILEVFKTGPVDTKGDKDSVK